MRILPAIFKRPFFASMLLVFFCHTTIQAQYFPVRAVNDQQVVIVPGTATGNVVTNDQIFNNGPFTLTQLSSPPNGTLTFNSTTGAYTYVPSGSFQGADTWTYQVCDGGPDGNLATTADNNCAVGRVVFRNIFSCKNTLFYVPIPENEARDFLEDINTGNNDPTQFYLGMSVLGEGFIIYDHWEDGYEANITNPVQPTTQIWGDGDLSNGAAPGFPTDIIPAGSTIILSNSLTSGHDNTSTYNPNGAGADATLQATVDYDGKDKVYASGEASMSKFAWGTSGTVSVSASSVPPTRDWGTSYILPVGQNTANGGSMFQITSLSIIAKENNTDVAIDRDANGTTDINVTLNEGETYYLDSRQGATIIAVNQGATINATKDVQVMLMTGDFNSGFAGRTYALVPTSTLSSTYYMPGVPQETVRVYLYNPTASALTVTRTTAGGATVNINVPANSSAFNDVNNSGLGYRYSASSPFAIVAAVDFDAVNSDWGFTPVPSTNISPVSLFSFAEGSDPTNAGYGTNNYSKILITPVCNTYVYVDVNGDGTPDKVSFNNDIDVLDAAVTIGAVNYNETTSDQGILVNQFQTLTIGGPAGTLNGARVWTKTGPNNTGTQGCDIAVVYGQDGGPNGAPNIDAGYTLPKTSIPLEVNTSIPSSVCPDNATSFVVPVLLNGTAPFNVLLFNRTTNQVEQFSTNSTTFNINARNPGNYLLKINDDNCLTFESNFSIPASGNCTTNAVNDENSTFVDFNVSGNVLTNDFDLEGNNQNFGSFLNQSTLVAISSGAVLAGTTYAGAPVANAGVITFGSDGSYTFDPEPGFQGTVSVPYQVCDDGSPSVCDTAVLTITVNPITGVSNSVIANNDENITYGSPVSGNVTVNDQDQQYDLFSVTAVTGGTVGTAFTVPGVSLNGTPVANAGTLVINADGSYIFTPTLGFFGSIDVPYTITDTPGATATATLHIDVLVDINGSANDAPFAGDDFLQSTFNLAISGSFAANDQDPNGNPISYAGVTLNLTGVGPVNPIGAPLTTAQGGTVQMFSNGEYLYTPPVGYIGADYVTYQICDVTSVLPQPLCAEATIHFLLCACSPNYTNAVNDENSTWQDVNVGANVLLNDFDIEANTQNFGTFLNQATLAPITSGATVSGVDLSGAPVANAGTLSFDALGNYVFDPAQGFLGTMSISYSICDNGSSVACDTAVLTITVSPVPASGINTVIANNDENFTYGNPVSGNVTLNDADPQGDAFTVTAVTGGSPGVSFTVSGIDRDGNTVANAGTLVINSDGSYTYTPAPGFKGEINVPYTITDANGATATAVLHIDVLQDQNGIANDMPFAGDDFSYTGINTPVTSSFIDNDLDPNGDQLSLNGTTIVTGGPATPIGAPVATVQGGTVQFFSNGTYTYTPPPGYAGPDLVSYTICDVASAFPRPLCTDANIHFLICPCAPNTTMAINDENSTWQDVNVGANVVLNDYDVEGNTQAFGSFLNQSTLAVISSGTTVSGTDPSGAPVANAGTLGFDASGNYVFNPEPSFLGTVSIPYSICDNGLPSACDTAVLTITVNPLPTTAINSVIANNDENISYGAAVSGNVTDNDADPQGDSFTVTAVTGSSPGVSFTVAGTDVDGNAVPNAGTLQINADGTYSYTPAPGFFGEINVPYTITDAIGATATAVLHIDVMVDVNLAANDAPLAGDDFAYTTENQPVGGSFAGNDNDPNADPISYSGVTIVPAGPATPIGPPLITAQGGTVQLFTNGNYVYTPPLGYTGPDFTTYTVCDVTAIPPQPLCSDATIHFLVGPAFGISGNVWTDANGDIIDQGVTEPATNAGGTLFVNLVDINGNVVAATAVANDGTYSFSNIVVGGSYSLLLSTTSGTVGQPAPAPSLPAGWVNTGTNLNGTTSSATPGLIDLQSFGYANAVNLDFGIEQIPETDDHTTVIPQPAVGQLITLNGGANPPVLSGLDAEDCPVGCTLANGTVIITSIPANATLIYNGVAVSSGQQISNFDPSLLQVEITSATLGATSTSFQYVFVDAAGVQDQSPATYTLTWSGPVPVTGLQAFATLSNNVATIRWRTETEQNTSHFIVERSVDQVLFEQTGTSVPASGSSQVRKDYSLPDDVARISQQPAIYYRVKLTDLDGRVTYSNVVTVRPSKTAGISVWPNPFVDVLTVSVYSNQPRVLNIRMLDATGKLVHRMEKSFAAGTTQLNIDELADLSKGVYILEMTDKQTGEKNAFRIVKN